VTEPARHLRPVDSEPTIPEGLRVVSADGEMLGEYAAFLQGLEDHIAGLQRDVRAEHLRYENLRRDKAAEAKAHPLWPDAVTVFKYWKKTCNHPKSAFSPDRFEQVRPFLEKHGIEVCKRAVDGAAFEPFTTKRRNGTTKRHDGWGLIFRATEPDKFEEFCNKAPLTKGTDDGGDDDGHAATDAGIGAGEQGSLPTG
jgi:hypothetical protein